MKKRILSALLALSLCLALLPGVSFAADTSPISPETAAELADIAHNEEICVWIALETAEGENVKTALDIFARDYLLGCNYCYPVEYAAPIMVLSTPKEHLLRMAGDSRVKVIRLYRSAFNDIDCPFLDKLWLGEGVSEEAASIDQAIFDYAALTDSLIPVEIRLHPIQAPGTSLADYKADFMEAYLADCEIPYQSTGEPSMIAFVPLDTVYAMAADERTELLLLALTYPNIPGDTTSGNAIEGTITEIRKAYQAQHPALSLADIQVSADYGDIDGSRVVTITTFENESACETQTYAYRGGEFLPTDVPTQPHPHVEPATPIEEGEDGSFSDPTQRAVYAAACESYQQQNPEYALSQISIGDDFGYVSGCRAMLLHVRPSLMECGVMTTYEEIAGYVFRITIWGAPTTLCILHKGEYVSLFDAYEDGLVREADVSRIYHQYYYTYGENDPPCAKAITSQELRNMCKGFLTTLKKDTANVRIAQDYGLYGGESDLACGPVRIVLVRFGNAGTDDLTLRSGDLIFRVPAEQSEQMLLAYQDGYFISLDRALEFGILTSEEAGEFFRDFWADGSNPFEDVTPESWYHDDVSAAFRNRLMNGVSDTRFSPDGTMTRAMLVTVLWRACGAPTGFENKFIDIPSDTWYTDAVAWAAGSGIVNGVGDGKFAPNSPITREQLVTILYRRQGTPVCDCELAFADADTVSPWAQSAMCWAVHNGILTGSARPNGTFLNPTASATRAQAAAILNRYMAMNE